MKLKSTMAAVRSIVLGCCFLICLGANSAVANASGKSSSDPSEWSEDNPPTIPEGLAEQFSSLAVEYHGRIAPMETLAEDYCLRVYGKRHLKDYTAAQVVTGWFFYYDWWRSVPVKDAAKPEKKAAAEDLVMEVASGRAFKIFPLTFADSTLEMNPGLPPEMWFSCDDILPAGIDYNVWLFVKKSLDLVHDDIRAGNTEEASQIISKIAKWQEKTAGEEIPSEKKFQEEAFYNFLARPGAPFMASLTIGLILFLLCCIWISQGKEFPKWAKWVCFMAAMALLIYLTIVIGLRWHLGGRGPFDSGYAVMMLIAWISALTMVLTGPKWPVVFPLGFLIAGFTMLDAWIAGADALINPLLPALKSPLLSYHVFCMMLSYTLLGIASLNGLMGLVVKGEDPKTRLASTGEKILIPAVAMLIIGTVIGSFWAKQAWGSWWSWDPKETWALVTIIVYLIVLGYRRISVKKGLRPWIFNLLCVIAFISVLITYYGVNLLFGGMHSYV